MQATGRNGGGGLAFPLSSISFLKRLIDVIHKEHWGVSKEYSWLFKVFDLNYETQFDNFPFSQIHSIEFVNSICVITKQEEGGNQLGLRVVSGDIEQVSAGIKGLNSTHSPTPNQDQNQWSNLKLPMEEELITCKRRIAELERQLLEIKNTAA
jgi:hypothetical protein